MIRRRASDRFESLWLRWRLDEDRWSIWHRVAKAPAPHVVTVGRRAVQAQIFHLPFPHTRTDCGLDVGVEIEHWRLPEMPPGPRCSACALRYLLATLPPLGSPSGQTPSGPGRIVTRARRRRPLSQPTL